MELEIAFGKSRKDINWKNTTFTWENLVKKLKTTHRTAETFAEYSYSKKDRQDEIKDIGGFVGGLLASGRRKKDTVIHRSLICLDVDHTKDFSVWEAFEMLYGYNAVLYTTHKHSLQSPHYRMVIPLLEPVTPDKYEAIARKIAGDLGINNFDDTTYEPSRLMYWPSTSKDGDFVFKELVGDYLNPSQVLSLYRDWTDVSSWPISDRIDKVIRTGIVKQGDPLEKGGVIGAFCRVYSISEAIDTFLDGIYSEVDGQAGRYSFILGSTTGGLVTYEDKYAYSHHGTDPISGKLCNAFDLVRHHKFGELDEGASDTVKGRNLPSYQAMVKFATSDKKTTGTLAKERVLSANEDFGIIADDGGAFLELLATDKQGKILSSASNLEIIMANDPNLKGKFAFDEFRQMPIIRGKLPWRNIDDNPFLIDMDDSGLRNYIDKTYGISNIGKINDALAETLYTNKFHPVRQYFAQLPTWDCRERVETYFIEYLGAADNYYTRTVTRKSLVACVARILIPGIKFDWVLTLTGKQGKGKSTAISKIAKEWFSDSLGSIGNKDAMEQLQGAWIIEMAEMASLNRIEANLAKHFLSKTEDRFRVAYGKRVQNFPRQCVFFGTTNHANFLKDPSGDRRFWPVEVGILQPTKNLWKDLTDDEIDQIWAEALRLYNQGEELHLNEFMEAEAKQVQESHTEVDNRLGILEEYLNLELPSTWDEMDTIDRQSYIYNKDYRLEVLTKDDRTYSRDLVCVAEVWCECFRKPIGDLTRNNSFDISNLIQKVEGWEKTGTKLYKIYGRQKGFFKKAQIVTK